MLQSSQMGTPLKVGIIRSSSIGDVVLATACLDLILQLPMMIEIYWIGRGAPLALLKDAYPKLQTIDLGQVTQISDILKLIEPVHFLVDLQTNFRSRLLGRAFEKQLKKPFYSCKKERFFRTRLVLESRLFGRKRTLPSKNLLAPKPQYQMMLDCVKKALEVFLPRERFDAIRNYPARPHLPLLHRQGSKKTWEKELSFGSWLAIACGASFPTKKAPLLKMVEILRLGKKRFAEKSGTEGTFGLVLLGDHNDQQASKELLDELAWDGAVLNLTGQLSLWEAALALQASKGIITNDSSLSHIAEAVGTPAAVLFGPTIESFGFAPWRSESKAFSTALGCRPCSKHGRTPCRFGDKLCFMELRSEDIANHIVQWILPDSPYESHS